MDGAGLANEPVRLHDQHDAQGDRQDGESGHEPDGHDRVGASGAASNAR